MNASPDFSTFAGEMRLLWLGEKDLRDRAISGAIKRTPEQIDRYNQVMRAIAMAGKIANGAAADPAGFMAWAKSAKVEL